MNETWVQLVVPGRLVQTWSQVEFSEHSSTSRQVFSSGPNLKLSTRMNKNFLITWYYDNTGRSRNRATGDLRSAHAVNPTVQGRGVKVRKSMHPDVLNDCGSLYNFTSIST